MNAGRIHAPPASSSGFTLIELAIVLVVIGIAAAIAYPIYQTQLLAGRRSDAVQAAGTIAQAQETWRSNNTTYGALTDLGIASTSIGCYYTLAITTPTATGYTLTLTPAGTQANDTTCKPMTMTVTLGNPAYSPPACWKR